MVTFGLHALVSGTLGPRLPALQDRTGVATSELGIALVGFAVGLFLGTRVAGPAGRWLGERRLIRIGVPCLAASLLGPALAGDLVALTAALVLLGVISGLLDVAMNGAAVHVEREVGRPILNGIHGLWSAGMLAGGLLAAGAAAVDLDPPAHFALVAGAVALASVPGLAGLLPDEPPVAAAEVVPQRPGAALRSAGVLVLGAVAFAALVAEGAANDWTAVYLDQALGASEPVAALGFAAFALGMTAARLLADRLTARAGPVAVVRAGGALAVAGLALALAWELPALAIAGFALLGVGLAPVVPIAFSAAGNLAGAARGALGWVVAFGYVGSVLGPALIGLATHAVSLRAALLIPAAASVLIALLAPAVRSAAGGGGH
jgi:MFS family permease